MFEPKTNIGRVLNLTFCTFGIVWVSMYTAQLTADLYTPRR